MFPSHAMSDISKLTVAKLKGLCKEQGLTNYSKLSKPALLAKLGFVTGERVPGLSTNLKPSGNTSTEAKISRKIATTDVDIPDAAKRLSSTAISVCGSTSTLQLSSGDLCQENQADPRTDAEMNLDPNPSDTPAISDLTTQRASLSSHSGSKRSADTAFDNTARALSKIPKKSHKIFSLGITNTFKVPEVPPLDGRAPPRTHGMDICAAKPSQSASHLQQNNGPSFRNLTKQKSLVSGSPSDQLSPVENVHQTSLSIQKIKQLPRRTQKSKSCLLNNTSQIPVHSSPVSGVRTVLSTAIPHPPTTPSTSRLQLQPPSCPQKSKFIPPRPKNSSCQTRQPGDNFVPHSPRHLYDTSNPVPKSLEVTVCENLQNITIPPSMSQRKHLCMISLALSGLDNAGRAICARVSKLFRYAIYVSAQDILRRRFSGERLSRLLNSLKSRGFSLNMINLWPYLRLRQRDVSQKKYEYEESWVPRFFHEVGVHTNPISNKLWTNPDSDEQLSVAFRFIQTRICLALVHRELGDTVLKWITSTVVDVQQVLENEIWSITVLTPGTKAADGHKEETFHVLYHTCEVIGNLSDANRNTLSSTKECFIPSYSAARMPRSNLRADWGDFISARLSMATRNLHAPLIEHIRDTNPEDFRHGVARGWSKRMDGQGEEGALMQKVAERYVFGCVMGNSVSGEYRSTTQMALEFAGLPEPMESLRHSRETAPRVNMFIPERHNVESVHFTKPGGLHPALAVVQTAGRQEGTLVLKENGVAIGEDETLPEVWMKLLQCNEKGVMQLKT